MAEQPLRDAPRWVTWEHVTRDAAQRLRNPLGIQLQGICSRTHQEGISGQKEAEPPERHLSPNCQKHC